MIFGHQIRSLESWVSLLKYYVCCFPAVPGPPVGILFPEVRTTSVRLIWQSPLQPNGIILG